jgi:GTP pyrophosphokinase
VSNQHGLYIEHLKYMLRAHVRYRWGNDGLVARAIEVAEGAHSHQQRDGGEPFIIHPLRVALHFLLVYPKATPEMVAVAVLHDVLEDAPYWSRDKLNAIFGDYVADGVERLSKTTSERSLSAAEYKRLIISSPEYIRVIKLCDRLDNIISLRTCPDTDKVQRYLDRTEAYYRDIAESSDQRLLGVILEEIDLIRQQSAT